MGTETIKKLFWIKFEISDVNSDFMWLQSSKRTLYDALRVGEPMHCMSSHVTSLNAEEALDAASGTFLNAVGDTMQCVASHVTFIKAVGSTMQCMWDMIFVSAITEKGTNERTSIFLNQCTNPLQMMYYTHHPAQNVTV